MRIHRLHQTRRAFPSLPRHIKILFLLIVLAAPVCAVMQDVPQSREQDFIITAYYSPIANQCCYVLGGEKADKVMNGEGRAGADGTTVYPGMIAAPASYAFGTRIVLPGIGIGTVHDRGGAIREVDGGHRLDLWVGYGEEGLARALAFGVRRVRGTVFLPGSRQPRERFVLDELKAPVDKLKPFLVLDYGLLNARPAAGQVGLSVTMLQETLRDLGYFRHEVTGKFGLVTQEALAAFLRDMRLPDGGDVLSERAAAYLMAAHRKKDADVPVTFVGPGSSVSDVTQAQRLLRFLDFYRGRTDGVYNDALREAILSFQKSERLVGDAASPGAGRIGPLTQARIATIWKRVVIAAHAERFLLLQRTVALLEKRGRLVEGFLRMGHTGPEVRVYQELLAERGLFPKEKINGVYGPLTRDSTVRYQISAGLIKRASDPGAGDVGAKTLRALRAEETSEAYRMVRAHGWNVL